MNNGSSQSIFSKVDIERVFKIFFQKMPLLGVALDTKGKVTFVNPYFLKVTGYSSEEILGKSWFDTCIPKELRSSLITTFTDILAKESYTRFENPILTKSGETRLISWTNAILMNNAGNVNGTLSIGEDITDLRRAEVSLLESEERFHKLADATPYGVAIHENGIMVLCNQKLADMSGYSVKEITGMNIMNFFPQESQKIIEERIQGDKEGCYRVPALKKDGTRVDVELCTNMTMYGGQRARVVTVREIINNSGVSA